MNASIMQYLPLDQLHRSPKKNTRKTGGTKVADLAASILAVGLLQNLAVEQIADDRFEVVAGDRRLRALWHLRDTGALPEELKTVPCLVKANGVVIEVSAAENIIREAMHPADQFEAFQKMVDGKKPIADIAAHFSVSETVVRQRLRLANLSPMLIDLFRADKATLAQMIALSISTDYAQQERVWNAARGDWQRNPDELRKAIVGAKLSLKDGIAVFVGVKDYERAGGAVERDLFGDDVYLADPKLVERLALQKLQTEVERLRAEGWSWVEARPHFGYQERQKFSEIHAEDWDRSKGIPLFSANQKAASGMVVSIDDRGQASFNGGLLKPGQKPVASTKPGASKAKPMKAPGTLPIAQLEHFAGQRTAAARLELAKRPREMLALLAAELTTRYLLSSHRIMDAGHLVALDRGQRWMGMGAFREGLEKSPAHKSRLAGDSAVAAKIKKEAGRGSLLAWLLKQPEQTTHELLAAVTAGMVNLPLGSGDKIVGDLGIDVAQGWEPSTRWFAGLQKGVIFAIVREVHGNDADKLLLPLNRLQLARKATELVQGSGWLPKPLRGAGYKVKRPKVKAAPAKSAKRAIAKKKPAPKVKRARTSAPKLPATAQASPA